MKAYVFKWSNGDVTVVCAKSKRDAFLMVDDVLAGPDKTTLVAELRVGSSVDIPQSEAAGGKPVAVEEWHKPLRWSTGDTMFPVSIYNAG